MTFLFIREPPNLNYNFNFLIRGFFNYSFSFVHVSSKIFTNWILLVQVENMHEPFLLRHV